MANNTIIIAEAGVNHNGDLEQACKLVDVAVEAGVDYVKFQTFIADKVVSQHATIAEYQSKNLGTTRDYKQVEVLKDLELSHDDHLRLLDYCNKQDIKFLSTPFDNESLQFLVEIGVDFLKLPSGELTNKPLLISAAKQNLPIILSTGMAFLDEVEAAIQVLTTFSLKLEDIVVLHCNTEYPTPFEDVNLLAMETMRNTLGVKVGYSDHTLGIEVPIAATAMGASIIEKHFTLDRNLPGPDHQASLEPDELKKMVKAIRNTEKALGSDRKEPSNSEKQNISVARKSIHTARELEKGTRITSEDLIMLRPGDGISPMDIDDVTGTFTKNKIAAGTKINWSDIGDEQE